MGWVCSLLFLFRFLLVMGEGGGDVSFLGGGTEF
jgi:hypothetical protein